MHNSFSLADYLLDETCTRESQNLFLKPYRFRDLNRARQNISLLAGEPPLTLDFLEVGEELLAACSDAPEPDASLNNFERFAGTFGGKSSLYRYLQDDPRAMSALAKLFGFSHFLSEILIRNPEYFDLVVDTHALSHSVSVESLSKELRLSLSSLNSVQGRRDAMRRFKRRQMLRVGFRDILQLADVPTLLREVSDIADVLIGASFELACQEVMQVPRDNPGLQNTVPAFSVFALGKLGGRELNYSSDIDLLFVSGHSDDRDLTRIAERTFKNLTEATGEGYLYRVDMRLRPQGTTGPLSPSIASCLSYYESWAEPWEWQALIKLRQVAGDAELGKRFAGFVESLIYAKQIDVGTITEIQHIKRRTERRSVESNGLSDVKVGPGGIRDVEFTIQLLQLLSGSEHQALHTGNTLNAIEALANVRQLETSEAKRLKHAYIFLRKLENYLQIVHEFPLHTLPTEPLELDQLARRMGYTGDDAGELLLAHIQEHRAHVRRIHLRYFHDISETSTPGAEQIENLLPDSCSTGEAEAVLRPYGFEDVTAALENLRLLALGPAHVHVPLRTRRLFLQIAPSLLNAMSSSPDPDQALNRLESLCSAVGNRASFLRSLSRNPQSIEMFATLGAVSEELMQTLLSHPEYLDMLMSPGIMTPEKHLGTMLCELRDRVTVEKDHDGKFNALRRYRHREMLRIGVRDLSNLSDTVTVHREISHLAESCLKIAFEIVCEGMGDLPFEQCAVIGMGKLGGEELHYGSDLDVAFVHDLGDKELRPTRLHAFCERFIRALAEWTGEGYAFKLDTRLRPEGGAGVMTRSLDSYEEYWQEWIEPWERLALLRVRPVAGDDELGGRFADRARHWNRTKPVDEETLISLRHMKQRIESERAAQESVRIDVKLGPGGLNDIEFTVQWLQLRHGAIAPTALTPHTFEGIERLWCCGILSEEEYIHLQQAYVFTRRVDSRLRLLDPSAPALLPKSGRELDVLTKSLRYQTSDAATGAELIDRYQSHATRVREILEKRFMGTG